MSNAVLCGRRNTFASLSQDELQFSCQAQNFGDLCRHFAIFCVAGAPLQTRRIAGSTLHTLHAFVGYTSRSTLYTPLHTPHSTLHTLHSALHTPCCTLYAPHSTLYTPHSTLYTPHSTLDTSHSTFHTLHSTLYTPHSTLPTLHSALLTLHSTLYTLHSTTPHSDTLDSTLYSLHSTVYTLNFSTLHFALHTLHFTLHTLHSALHTFHFTLHTLHFTILTPQSTLYTPHLHSTLHTLHSTLYTEHSRLYWVQVVSCFGSPEVVSGRCAVGKCVLRIYMILLFHWIIAYCKTTRRIGTLNSTYMNLPFVVINLLVCLSIAGHTMQGHTGCHKRVWLLWVYFVWYLWHPNAVACSVKENVWPWVFQWFCAAQQILCQHRCACHLVLVGSSLGTGSML